MELVSCISTALETCNYRIVASKDIYDLTFTFVAPLEAENYVKFHICFVLCFCLIRMEGRRPDRH